MFLRRLWFYPSLEGIVRQIGRRRGHVDRGSASLGIGKDIIVFHATKRVLNVIEDHIILGTSVARLGSGMSSKVGNQGAGCSASDTM